MKHISLTLTKSCLMVLFLAIGLTTGRAQQGPAMVWGEVDTAELKMKSYHPDTNAAAVVLFDVGRLEFTDDVGFILKRHKRIKIFTKEGYDQATEMISLYSKDHMEKIRDIEGATYVIGPDGSVMKIEMDDNAIFKTEDDNEFTHYKFTLPSLEPGCVIEFRYEIKEKDVFSSRPWYFQSAIPERWSEFQVVFPKTFAFAMVKQGYENFFISEQSDEFRNVRGHLRELTGEDRVSCSKFRYVLKDVPAVRDEPFMTTPEDYRQKVSLQLAEYITPYSQGVVTVMKTWKTFVQEMADDKTVGKAVDDTKTVRKLTEPLVAGLNTPGEKLRAIYDYVRKNIVWSGRNRWWAEKDVDDVLDSKTGSSAEITTLLLSMMHVAGINGCPVILSTRAHGLAQEVYPIANQYNYSLAAAFVDGKTYYLDATDPLRPMNVLPVRVLNTRGLLIRPESVDFVTLSTGAYYHHEVTAAMTLSEAGELKGIVETVDKDYAAVDRRQELKDKKPVEVEKQMLGADRALITVDSVSVSGQDSTYQAIGMRAAISASSYAESSSGLLYFNPFVVERQYDNPFKLPTRKFPVDMLYPQEISWDYTVVLPEGYDVKELPQDCSIALGKSLAGFSRKCRLEGRTLKMHASFAVRQTQFLAEDYQTLKDLYQKMTTAENDQLVLKKHATTAKAGL